ncbi:MAG: ribonuclease Y [Candidatus Nealsonbacteria bacterium CG23_combo_of_CG06-09_8_20_14_all_40_13]|uniref:Ribonuclease Y n=1 Tax=Candidatus Nealsonbacteria bacterium CG23_combo_of_CG06-09_8_20_14_all_40_13 TaxID=1974724 RepID=A0A2G9YRI3_9BACT|nr:MAG: ribonuclease Y [Candidatus Nealsonbacteria bacterium CG23_combo_of_CG06-09_8_20_14_all_40_13]PIR71222.1 MAG: ribonuclease Y [Candidatus Nealsonbacteria bacterium CG10_big_fil_rev_8_21_14_0_10_40_24]PIU43170.1 MAG: ribonuclease Y [Candidatus Nealsonbacteria bacterium CG07_land_8_20_14_0_80_40_10]
MTNLIIYVAAAAVVGGALGLGIARFLTSARNLKSQAKQKELLLSAKDEALKIKETAKKEEEEKRRYLQEIERNLRRKEANLDLRFDTIERERQNIGYKEKEISKIKSEIELLRQEEQGKLEKVAKLSKEEAKKLLLDSIEKEYKEDVVAKIQKTKKEAQDVVDIEARKILSSAIQRLATEHVAESTISSVNLPSDEMKGRIIGREGRNIQLFEKLTGVDVIIDDTPEAVVLSSFDPVRRHIAKMALDRLIADGRIQPAKIEEAVAKAEKEISQEIKEAGETACYDLSITGLHPDLVRILGRLKFRTSYGQNVLQHSIEVAHLASMLASELGADVSIAKKAGLLHDIGKAVDHEIAGAHHHISRDIAKKYGMSEDVMHAIEAHHDDIEPKSVEAIVVRVADAISGARPGARRESLDNYIKRLTELENIANSFDGVEKSYAIQAGREVRIIVKPEDIDDLSALKLAKDIAKKIETDLQYPGTIKVNVIREVRATEFAK